METIGACGWLAGQLPGPCEQMSETPGYRVPERQVAEAGWVVEVAGWVVVEVGQTAEAVGLASTLLGGQAPRVVSAALPGEGVRAPAPELLVGALAAATEAEP